LKEAWEMKRKVFLLIFIILLAFTGQRSYSAGANMTDYCYIPPTIGTAIPPLVMLVMERDHRLYYEAYNDASDLDVDGKLDVGYKHSIDYYGYFDPYKCYVYQGSGANAKFVPSYTTSDKYCRGDAWSGNFLNWLTMSRIDVLKKVLYGGRRGTDSASETVLSATYIPQDAHSWGKEVSLISGERSYVPNIDRLTPLGNPTSGRRHLFCVVSKSDGEVPVIRVLRNRTNRIWEWASKEVPVCDNSLGTPEEYYVRVKVCDPSVGLEPNCKRYPAGTYKPIGLLQKYGEYEGGGKWCSKSLKPCNSDSDCNISTDGLCVDKAKMYFGLLTGSYTKNLSGGVLRKNIWSIQDELNLNTGIFQSSENVPGNIILTLEGMKVIGFGYPPSYNYYYYDNCGWITTPLSEGVCRMWGNPIAEMMYEALRYLAGKGTPTSSFTYSGTQDSGLNLPKPAWGIRQGSSYYQPYQLFPICAKPFMLVLSDINVNFDSDSLPGSSFGGISGDLTGLNVSTLSNTISTNEGISGNYFIGQSGSFYDFICSSKSVSGFANIRGLCPEEPTKQGSYYSAAVAYYGNTRFRDNFSGNKPPNVKTYSVALASSLPDISINVGGKTVRITPLGKSVSGCGGVYTACSQRCTITRDATGNLRISGCTSNAFCPTNQIVDFYVEQVNYDSSGNLTYAKFRINFEDVEQGADHDMDAVALYEIVPIGSNQIQIRVTSDYAAGCIDQVLGFTISGTTEDGTWLVVRDMDASPSDGDTPSVVAGMPLTWQRTFTVTGGAAGQLKNPLWYAAKWGGFDDQNGNNVPDLPSEWDKDGDGNPDTYFFVVNPLKMEEQLEKAFADILRRASSGSTVATLTSRTGISSLIVQPYYYPKYVASNKEISWLGFLRSFWIDVRQNLREDTTEPKVLNIAGTVIDKIFQFFFDSNDNETKVAILQGSDTTSSCVMEGTKSINEVIPVFDAGCQLAYRDPSDRTILYNKNGTLTPFTTSESSYLSNIWKVCSNNPTVLCTNNGDCGGGTCQPANASCIIRYLRGENLSSDSSCPDYVKRTREVDIANFCPGASGVKTWRIGDIINSTPSVVSSEPVNIYHLRYNDATYLQYIRTDAYKNRTSFVFVGANDGMLHAFRVGRLVQTGDPDKPTKVVNAYNTSLSDLVGREEWAFIPRNALPYLVWYGNPSYCRVPTVDYRTAVFDVSIGGPANADKTVSSWRTILIGTMGFGGKSITTSAGTFSSSVFALDLTDWLNGTSAQPTLLWEVSLPDGTLTTAYPAVVRLGDPNKNGEWYVVIGSGPLNPNGTSFTSQPKLYFIDLRNGNIVRSVNIPATGGVNFAVGDIAVVDVDSDYQDDVLYFGVYGKTNAGNVWGNFYRLSLRSGSNYKTVSALTQSDICTAIDLGTFATAGNTPPVFGAPNFTKDENGKLWVFFGTGRYVMNSSDKAISYDNYLIGFKDENWNSGTCPTPYTKAQLTDITDQPLTITITEVKQICMCDASGCGMRDVVYGADGSMPPEPTRGWYYRLTGEAIYSQALVIGGIVDALTYVPPEDICQMEGKSNLISVYYKTGRPYPRPSVLSPNVVSGTIAVGQSAGLLQKISVGQGVPPIGNPFQALQSSQASQQLEKFAQVSSGVVLRLTQQKATTSEEKFLLWIEK
jgi:type IV pilus assembly protein PilY1